MVSARRCNSQNHDPIWLKRLRSIQKRNFPFFSRDLLAIRLKFHSIWSFQFINNLSLFALQILKIRHQTWTQQNCRNIWSYPVSVVLNRSKIERKWFQQDVVTAKITTQFGLNAWEVFKGRIFQFSRDILASRLKFHSNWSFQYINNFCFHYRS